MEELHMESDGVEDVNERSEQVVVPSFLESWFAATNKSRPTYSQNEKISAEARKPSGEMDGELIIDHSDEKLLPPDIGADVKHNLSEQMPIPSHRQSEVTAMPEEQLGINRTQSVQENALRASREAFEQDKLRDRIARQQEALKRVHEDARHRSEGRNGYEAVPVGEVLDDNEVLSHLKWSRPKNSFEVPQSQRDIPSRPIVPESLPQMPVFNEDIENNQKKGTYAESGQVTKEVAEADQSIENAFESRHEIKDVPTRDIEKPAIATQAGAAQTQNSQLSVDPTGMVPIYPGRQHSNYSPVITTGRDDDLYRKAIQMGFVGGLLIFFLIALASFL